MNQPYVYKKPIKVYNYSGIYSGLVNENGEPHGNGEISFSPLSKYSGIWDNGKLTNATFVYCCDYYAVRLEGEIDEKQNFIGKVKQIIEDRAVGKTIICAGNYVNGNFDGPATITEGKTTFNVTYHNGIIVGADESYFKHFGENGVAFNYINSNGSYDLVNSENKILIDKINADATTNKIELEACMVHNIDDCISNKEKTMLYIVSQINHNFIVVCDTKGNKCEIDNGALLIFEPSLSRKFSHFKEKFFPKFLLNRYRYIVSYNNSDSKYITPGIRTGPCVNIANANAILFLEKFKKNNQNFDKTIKDIKNTKLDDKLMVNLVSLYTGGLPNNNFGTTFPVSKGVNMLNRTHNSTLSKYNINGINQHHYSCPDISAQAPEEQSILPKRPNLIAKVRELFGRLLPSRNNKIGIQNDKIKNFTSLTSEPNPASNAIPKILKVSKDDNYLDKKINSSTNRLSFEQTKANLRESQPKIDVCTRRFLKKYKIQNNQNIISNF